MIRDKDKPYYMVEGARSIFYCPKFGCGLEGKIGGEHCSNCTWSFKCMTSEWLDPIREAAINNGRNYGDLEA